MKNDKAYLEIPLILFELDITPIERYLLSLCISYGGEMYASNSYLAGLFHVSRRSIIDALNRLVERGFVDRSLEKKGRIISLAAGEIIALLDDTSGEVFSGTSEISSPEAVKFFPKSGAVSAPNRKGIENNDRKEKILVTSDFIFPLRDGEEYALSADDVQSFKESYPRIDVPAEFRKIVSWNVSNPARRKTRSGILRHINSWLSKADKKGRDNEKTTSDSRDCGQTESKLGIDICND